MCKGLVFLCLLLGLVMAGTTEAAAGSAADKPAFTATPAELLAAAKATPAGDWPAVILRDDEEITFDDRGRETRRWHRVFSVATQGGVDDWGSVGMSWSPFYQDRPVVRARVILPSAKVIEIDQTMITDAPTVETSPTIYSDRRNLRAPLPRLEIGAVVEEELTVKDREPVLAAGSVETVWIGADVPVASTSVTFSAPSARKARQFARGLDAKVRPRHETKGGRETWSYELGALPATPELDSWVPGETVVQPYIGITTSAAWSAVTKSYRTVLDKRISDGPFVLPAELPKSPSLETVRTIVSWLHRQIRYTGIEFGEASNIPWPPAETVKRGFGDCKDKATLLVAMLRQAGIRADLALLLTGPGRDVDPDLAGIDVFDHAIVRAQLDGKDLWIDATEDLVPVGDLPERDRGRRALVISPETTKLVVTPRPIANTIREVRTFDLAESGTAKVTEVSSASGIYDSEDRSWISGSRAEDLRKDLTTYVESQYKAKRLDSYTTTPPADLTKPLELTIVASEAARAFTGRDRIDIYLYPNATLGKVPKLVKSEDKGPVRSHDFEWPAAHSYEIENRLVVPPGYSVPAAVPAQTRKLGTATFTETRKVEGRTFVVTFRFESGKERLTPAEVVTLRTAVMALAKDEVHVVIENTGWALADRGKPREAIAEIERMVNLHPKEARHQTELAYVLLTAGAAAAARRAAQKAVELEPTNADAYSMLGWVLRRDSLGREFGFDYDRAGAIAAYAKARKLDPKHVGAAIDQASMLEHDPESLDPGAERDLSSAVEARKAALALDDTTENKLALARVLLRSGKGAEAEVLTRGMPSSEARDPLFVAATALGSGGPAAIAAAGALRTGAGRSTLLDGAAALLMVVRAYDAARGLFAETGTMRPGTAQGMLVQKIAKHTDKFVVGKDPAKVAIDLTLAQIDPLYVAQSPWDAELRDAFVKEVNASQLAALKKLGRGYFYDIARSAVEARVEGKATGPWRVDAEAFGQKFEVYVVLDRNAAKAVGSPQYPMQVGRHVLRLLAANDLTSAKQLLDWLKADLDRTAGSAPGTLKLAKLWGSGLASDARAATLAAAVLAAGGAGGRAIAPLEKCATPAADPRALCDLSLVLALLDAKRWTELAKAAEAWAAREPDAEFPVAMQGLALERLGRFDDADKVLATRIATHPGDRQALMQQVQVSVARGSTDEAIRRFRALVTMPAATSIEKNDFAWFLAAVDKELPVALEYGRAGTLDQKHPAAAFNTVAVIEAELGDLGAAKSDGWKAIELDGRTALDAADWYLLGRIAEQLGFRDDAIADYKRVTGKPDLVMPSAADFAKRRLKVLGVP